MIIIINDYYFYGRAISPFVQQLDEVLDEWHAINSFTT